MTLAASRPTCDGFSRSAGFFRCYGSTIRPSNSIRSIRVRSSFLTIVRRSLAGCSGGRTNKPNDACRYGFPGREAVQTPRTWSHSMRRSVNGSCAMELIETVRTHTMGYSIVHRCNCEQVATTHPCRRTHASTMGVFFFCRFEG